MSQSTNTMQTNFASGAIVKHKVAALHYVVLRRNTRCVNKEHSRQNAFDITPHGRGGECDVEFAGTYDLSSAIGQVTKDVSEVLLEPVE